MCVSLTSDVCVCVCSAAVGCNTRLFALRLTLVRTDEKSVCEMPHVLAYALLCSALCCPDPPSSALYFRQRGREQQEILLSQLGVQSCFFYWTFWFWWELQWSKSSHSYFLHVHLIILFLLFSCSLDNTRDNMSLTIFLPPVCQNGLSWMFYFHLNQKALSSAQWLKQYHWWSVCNGKWTAWETMGNISCFKVLCFVTHPDLHIDFVSL